MQRYVKTDYEHNLNVDVMEREDYINLIKFFYNGARAKRSGVPLMNHIFEGVYILEAINASEDAICAYIIHPIAQSTEEVIDNPIGILAKQYAEVANSYLCRPETDHFKVEDVPVMPRKDIRDMLFADKLQNFKDFMLYHYGTHERSKELYRYFNNWLQAMVR